MNSTADLRLDDAKKHVQGAVCALGEIVVNKCQGHDDLTPEYRSIVSRSFQDLLDIQRKLDP